MKKLLYAIIIGLVPAACCATTFMVQNKLNSPVALQVRGLRPQYASCEINFPSVGPGKQDIKNNNGTPCQTALYEAISLKKADSAFSFITINLPTSDKATQLLLPAGTEMRGMDLGFIITEENIKQNNVPTNFVIVSVHILTNQKIGARLFRAEIPAKDFYTLITHGPSINISYG